MIRRWQKSESPFADAAKLEAADYPGQPGAVTEYRIHGARRNVSNTDLFYFPLDRTVMLTYSPECGNSARLPPDAARWPIGPVWRLGRALGQSRQC
jgi:hypothetical protein